MSALDQTAGELTMTLIDQTRVWARLTDLAEAQLEALQRQDVHSVHAILQEIEVTMLERSRSEVRRGVLVAQVASVLGIAVDEVTRDVICTHCSPEIAGALIAASDTLRGLVTTLDGAVARNTAMLEQELAIIEVLVRGATTDVAAPVTYGKYGQQSQAPRLRLLDAQV
jgi:hypothetical protein